MDFNSNFFNDLNDILYGEYVPPCSRHPYYDDPRDVRFTDVTNAHTTSSDDVVTMRQCPKCGTYFQPLNSFDSPFCFGCR